MSIHLHNKNLTKSLYLKRNRIGINHREQNNESDDNEICKAFLSKIVDETCEALILNNNDQEMHLPMWLMEYYNDIIKLYSMDNTEANAMQEDHLTHYMDISVNLFNDIATRIDEYTGQRIFLKVRNEMLKNYSNKATYQLIFLLSATYRQNENENE